MNNEKLKDEVLINFNNSNYLKAIELCEKINNFDLLEFKKEILIFSNFKLDYFLKTIEIINEFYKEKELYKNEKILHILSLCYLNIKDFNNCISVCNKILIINSENDFIYNIIGVAYSELKEFEKSNRFYIKCLNKNPKNLEARYNYGLNFFHLENFDESEKQFENIILLNRNFRNSMLMLGIIKSKLNKNDEAINIFTDLIKINENNGKIYFNLGIVHQNMKNYMESNKYLNKAIELKYNKHECLNSIGINYQKLRNYDEAKNLFQQSINLNKGYRKAYNNLAILLQKSGHFKSALENYNKALELNDNHALTLFNKSICLLEMGKYEEGIELYKWRQNGKFSSNKFLDLKNIRNKTILITCDQGLGDTILFSRFLILLLERQAKIIFLVSKSMFSLMQNLDTRIKVVTKEPDKKYYDYKYSLGDFLKIFNINIYNIPKFQSYIKIPKKYIDKWNKKISKNKFKIGIVWQGKKDTITDEGRSIELDYFKNISKFKNVELISLQKNDGLDQIKEFRKNYKILNFDSELDIKDKFMDTAGLMKNLNLVICSDTSVPHLAGALGVKVWIILQKFPFWYWNSKTTNSMWYDSIKIYKQKKVNYWDDVFEKIENDLKKLLNKNN